MQQIYTLILVPQPAIKLQLRSKQSLISDRNFDEEQYIECIYARIYDDIYMYILFAEWP